MINDHHHCNYDHDNDYHHDCNYDHDNEYDHHCADYDDINLRRKILLRSGGGDQ